MAGSLKVSLATLKQGCYSLTEGGSVPTAGCRKPSTLIIEYKSNEPEATVNCRNEPLGTC
jgi:hypothetical protein